jgi:DNA-directed RNA polymerase specialized sigma24 family protein
MTTAGNDTTSTREDEFLAAVYQQAIGAQAVQYATAWDAGTGRARFTGWLQDHAAAGPEPAADQAVARLYALHYRPLVRLAALLVRDAATAEEVVQDSFVAMRSGWQRLRDPERALAYLRQAVVSRSRSMLRHRTVPGDNPQQVLPDTPEAEHGAPGLLEQPAARAALAGLPDRQREAIVLAITRACPGARSPPRWHQPGRGEQPFRPRVVRASRICGTGTLATCPTPRQ